MGRRIFITGLGPKDDARHPREFEGLMQPPYSKERFQLLRDQVWFSLPDEGVIAVLGDLKVERVLSIETTNAANIFMEQFYECFPEPEYYDILSDAEGSYWLGIEQIQILFNHLLVICDIFYPKEFKQSTPPHTGIEIKTDMEAWATNLFDKEWTKRAQNPDAYEAKWGADYFNFSLLEDPIFKGLQRAEIYPGFIVFDA